MRLIVGLGNPGPRYEGTRHNLGFMIVEAFADVCKASFREGKGDFVVARTDLEDAPVAIIKPTTFMNDSGIAVSQAVELYKATLQETLIVFDDFQLPLGTIRLRPRGTDGGHHGMASVIYQTGSDEIPRLRGGIGPSVLPSDDDGVISFVLSPFDANERPRVRDMIELGVGALRTCMTQGLQAAMNEFNRNPET